MFLSKYLNEINYELLLDSYDYNYINSLDEKRFIIIYNLFLDYKFTFIEDIILRYLEVFSKDKEYVEEKLLLLIRELGPNYLDIISNDMSYLNNI